MLEWGPYFFHWWRSKTCKINICDSFFDRHVLNCKKSEFVHLKKFSSEKLPSKYFEWISKKSLLKFFPRTRLAKLFVQNLKSSNSSKQFLRKTFVRKIVLEKTWGKFNLCVQLKYALRELSVFISRFWIF